jgi:hypothetical protein
MLYPKDLVGERFGRLVVLSKDDDKKWICQCDCGKIKSIARRSLCFDGKSKTRSCGCMQKEAVKNYQYKGFMDISQTYWYHNVLMNAQRRNIPVNVTKEEVWEKYLIQGGLCRYTKIPIKFGDNASIDRIDSSIDYDFNNIQIVHKLINQMKQGYGEDEFLQYCQMVANPVVDLSDLIFVEKRRSHNFSGIGLISGTYIAKTISSAVSRKIKFDVEPKDLWQKFLDQNGNCVYTGSRLSFASSYKRCKTEQTASLDRIDSSLGYTKDNIQWVHKKINWMKWEIDESVFVEMCKLVTNRNKE